MKMSNYKNLTKLVSYTSRLNAKITFMKEMAFELDPEKVEKFTKLVEKAVKFKVTFNVAKKKNKK